MPLRRVENLVAEPPAPSRTSLSRPIAGRDALNVLDQQPGMATCFSGESGVQVQKKARSSATHHTVHVAEDSKRGRARSCSELSGSLASREDSSTSAGSAPVHSEHAADDPPLSREPREQRAHSGTRCGHKQSPARTQSAPWNHKQRLRKKRPKL